MTSRGTLPPQPKGKPTDNPAAKIAAVNDTRKTTTRAIVPPQLKGKPSDKTTNKIGEARNRRVLKEIGNLAVVPQRPLTRKLSTQIQANDPGKAVPDHHRDAANPPQENGGDDGGKPVDVIEISPDTEKCEGREEGGVSLKKKAAITHSSILSARSRAVIDIDAADAGNELAAVEYVEDLYKYYKETEDENKLFKYMAMQPDINPKMRSILVDWLIDVHNKFELSPETLYLTVNIIDRYLAKEKVARKEIQLLGMSAMLTASKYEDIWAPEVNDLVMITDRAYGNREILAMEKNILRALGWSLTVPTPYVFLLRFIKASIGDSTSERVAYFLAELGLTSYEVMVGFSPSMFAAAAVYVARCVAGAEPKWTETLRMHSGYEERELRECGEMLVKIHGKAVDDVKIWAVVKKYSRSLGGAAALPAKLHVFAS